MQDLTNFIQLQDRHITIVGGGLTACELATFLALKAREKGLRITMVVPEQGLLSKYFPSFLSEHATRLLGSEHLKIVRGRTVTRVRVDENDTAISDAAEVNVGGEVTVSKSVQVVLDDDTIHDSHYVIVAAGIEPNTEVAKSMNLEIDQRHAGIAVNSQLLASDGVYAAGDVASYYDRTLRTRRRAEWADNAALQGHIAGYNMSTKPKIANEMDDEDYENAISKAAPKHYSYQPLFSSMVAGNFYHGVGVVDPSTCKTFAVFDKSKGKYEIGVVYYLRDELDDDNEVTHRMVGMLLWNVPRIKLAQRLLKSQPKIRNKEDLIRMIPLEPEPPIPEFNPMAELEREGLEEVSVPVDNVETPSDGEKEREEEVVAQPKLETIKERKSEGPPPPRFNPYAGAEE